ncbi:hypothetical protein E1298_02445 [Actinomadura rubrisoli]|uniref:DDE Tnp4 domain-containing protein n=1 Tax=Actinomadura rubrisoli TaxID=2530368 RepID=A0A4R5C9Z3_9ACTN|nr:hypothetical protein E1298_02445 [Actinomadura rubrisoli]
MHLLVLDGTLIHTDRVRAVLLGQAPRARHERAGHLAGIITLADKGSRGADTPVVVTPYKGKNKPESQKQANRSYARLRGPGERANAQLKSWEALRKLRCNPCKAATWSRPSPSCKNTKPADDEKGSLQVLTRHTDRPTCIRDIPD